MVLSMGTKESQELLSAAGSLPFLRSMFLSRLTVAVSSPIRALSTLPGLRVSHGGVLSEFAPASSEERMPSLTGRTSRERATRSSTIWEETLGVWVPAEVGPDLGPDSTRGPRPSILSICPSVRSRRCLPPWARGYARSGWGSGGSFRGFAGVVLAHRHASGSAALGGDHGPLPALEDDPSIGGVEARGERLP